MLFALFLLFFVSMDAENAHEIEKTKKAFENDIHFPNGMNYTQYIASTKNIIPDDSDRWTDGVVYYTIDSAFNSVTAQLITDSLNEMSEQIGYRSDGQKCITFQERNAQQNYLNIILSDGCWSYIGMITGTQPLSIGYGCEWKGIIKHEVMHALGFWHEQSRPDRDTYVTVHYENIDPNNAYNFDKLLFTRVLTAFDLDSIMIYDNYAYSINGEMTLTANNGQPLLHAYLKPNLTELNREAIRLLYQCDQPLPTTTTTTTEGSVFVCVNDGYFANPNDCKRFYRCVSSAQGFTRYEFVCSAGTVWSNLINTCVFGTNTNCPQYLHEI